MSAHKRVVQGASRPGTPSRIVNELTLRLVNFVLEQDIIVSEMLSKVPDSAIGFRIGVEHKFPT